MADHQLTPVFTGLRFGLHVLTAALLAVVVVRIVAQPPGHPALAMGLWLLFALIYLAGAQVARLRSAALTYCWLAALTVCWLGQLVLVPEAAYLAFPMFFLYLHLLPGIAAPLAVLVATAAAVLGIGWHSGFTPGGVIGPVIGAGVALLIGLGYQALQREAVDRERLLAELVAAQNQLAASEREQGMLAERARLAREIHDTVAQDLSSIGMLLHAAERVDPDHPGAEYIRTARETAGTALAETRGIVRELTPQALDDGLPSALRRIAESTPGVSVTVDAPEIVDLPMDLQTTVLRIVQGAMANVVQHAGAAHARVRLGLSEQELALEISDDGTGFDPAARKAGSSDSFGLHAIQERVDQWGGTLNVTSAPGRGTTVTARIPRAAA
ncbi:signal transduction histidine kinase [Branchiibius hedensis]|uniref:Oxygen sensor histidine kinase NreB n=1 Tax=Branchiibius hedensis TaxID=672460 RepID=A0A2Y9BUS8_9MICO|nr:sensor histidine kinase [Branchiibius hedensis]PWJ27412.1 signal transduction histidine kinase [Branchiibius hedensis]SSA36222.1 Signal transduction histidine kinase [Branchiibius hedensis]